MMHRRAAVISTLGVIEILAWGSSYYLLAVIAGPISAETGWPLTWITAGLSGGLLVAGLLSPLIGRTVGRHGGRPVLAGSAMLLALGLTLLGTSRSFPVFCLAWLVLGAGMGAGLYDAAFATLGRTYGEGARSAITALTLWGGFASTVCWPLSAFLVEQVGWRGTCFVYAAIQAGFSLPLILALIPRPPPLPPAAPAGTGANKRPEGGDRRPFLLLAAIGVCGGVISAAFSVHLLTVLQQLGLSLAAAVSLGALFGPAQVGARILEAAGRGRHHPLWTLTAALALVAAGLASLGTGAVLPGLAIILYGGGNGLFSIARGTVPLALFGPSRYAALVGALALPNLLAQALAPWLGAWVITRFGAGAALAALACLGLVNLGLVLGLWACRRPGQG